AHDFISKELAHRMPYLISYQCASVKSSPFYVNDVYLICFVVNFIVVGGKCDRCVEFQITRKVIIARDVHVKTFIDHLRDVDVRNGGSACSCNQLWIK